MSDNVAPNDEILETLSTRDLVKSWKQDFGIDVAHLFDGISQIEMRQDPQSGRIRFEPCVEGDPAFYQALRQFNWYHPKRKLEHAHAAEYAHSGDLVLDIGAGNGDFHSYLRDADYLGLENDDRAVETANKRGRDLRPLSMAAWRAADDFRPAEMVTAFQVLEHVEHPDTFVREMASCLAPGGTLILGVPDAESYVSELPDLMLNAPPHHVSWWTEPSLRQLLLNIGFRVDEVKRFPVEPWEYQLWWMAKIAGTFRSKSSPRFGASLRFRKVLSFILSWPLQWISPPRSARGSTLLVTARRSGAES